MIFIRTEIPSLYNNLNVHPLEFNFSESYSLLAQFMLLNCGFKLDRKKNKYYIPSRIWDIVFVLFSYRKFYSANTIHIQVEQPRDLARDSGQRKLTYSLQNHWHPRGEFISVGYWTPIETNLLSFTT